MSGHTVIIGTYFAVNDLDPGVGLLEFNAETYGQPFAMIVDSNGILDWAWANSNIATELPIKLSVDVLSNVYFCGKMSAIGDIDPSPNELLLNATNDAVAIKLTPDGELEWATIIGAGLNTTPTAIAVDSAGFVYTTGRIGNNYADFDPGPDTAGLYVADGHMFVHKLSPDLELVWVKQLVTDGWTWSTGSRDMVLYDNEYLYLTGTFRDTTDFDPGPGTAILSSNGKEDVFVMKMNLDGELIWAKSFGGTGINNLTNLTDQVGSLAVTATGKVIVVGSFSDTCDFDPGPEVDLRISQGENDMFIMQLTEDGELDWAHTLGSTEIDEARNVAIDDLGNIHVSGVVSQEVDLNPGPGSYYLPLDEDSVMHFVAIYNTSGNFINAFATDMGFADIDLDNAGNFYGVGSFNDTTDFDPSPYNEEIAIPTLWNDSTFSTDAFVLKLNIDSLLTTLQEETERTGQLTVAAYPNPSTGSYNVFLSEPENVRYSVSDVRGQIIQNNTVSNTNHFNIEITGTTGIYFLEVIAGEDKRVIKLVKH